jgi:hypothetical protein
LGFMLLTSQFPSMCMVRSPKAIAGVAGLALGNAPCKSGFHDRKSFSSK